MNKRKGRMPFREAMGLVDDDLPDGAFWAMAHEMAGIEYGEGFAELAEEYLGTTRQKAKKHVPCSHKGCKKKFVHSHARDQHVRDFHQRPASPGKAEG